MTQAVSKREKNLMLGLLQCEESVLGIACSDVAEVCLIDQIEPLAATAPGIMGAITVRDVFLPICDPLSLCNLPSRQTTPKAAAIIWDDSRMIALAIDGILGIRRWDKAEVQQLGAHYDSEVLKGHLVSTGETINLIDAGRILDLPGMPSAPRHLRGKRGSGSRRRLPYLTFSVGGVTYAVAATHIQGSVPRREIEDTQLANGILLGFLRYMGRRLPVVETNVVLGLGRPRSTERPEFVVLQFGDGRILGLAVDRIRRIEYVSEADMRPVQARLCSAVPSVRSTFKLDEDDYDAFVLDLEGLREMPALAELATLSETSLEDEAPSDLAGAPGKSQDILRERRRYLIFHAGRRLAAPIAEIERIMVLPESTTPVSGGALGVEGLFFAEGRPVPLVDLNALLRGLPTGPAKLPRLLLVERDGERVGFRVDKIDGIAISSWRTRPEARLPGAFDNAMVSINQENVLVDCVEFGPLSDAVQNDMLARMNPLLQRA